MGEDDLNLEGIGRPIAGRRRFSNASPADQRSFLKAFMDERINTWKDSSGTVYKINRRGTPSASFAASGEIVSQPTRSQKLRATRLAKRDKNLAIKNNATKRAHGLTKEQRALRGQGELFASSDVAATDEQIQRKVTGDIKRQRSIKPGTQEFKRFLVSQGVGLSIAPVIGTTLDDIFALKTGEQSSGSGGGRMISRPRKAI
jgi:hypothetical protein